mmetsp:Transcript_25057/g.34416  ORF Transcript_25057/g.34416 Transcript_25057/m.34416 type:complete len:940 (-) Transcript_25057:67-2886(-)
MKIIFIFLSLLFVTIPFGDARCPNSCSGHGLCNTSSVCTCYSGWNGGAADCSYRECPFGIAWVDKAYSSNVAHQLTECSNSGYCDRSKGLCVCYPGFTGSSCQRATCPNGCSGHGLCGTLYDISISEGPDYDSRSTLAGDGVGIPYSLWDRNSNAMCSCDSGYYGPDCSLVMCPKGDDPLTTNQNYASILLSVEVKEITGKLGIEYQGKVIYISLTHPGDCGTLLSNNGHFGIVGCSFAQTIVEYSSYVATVLEFTLTFYNWPTFPKENNLYSSNGKPSIYDFFCDITYTNEFTICKFTEIESSNIREYAFCSNRGSCDFNTGDCTCVDGFGGPACSNITYLHHHGSNSKPGLEVSVTGLDYTSTALQISSARSSSSSFKFIEAIAASETVFYVDGEGSVGINKLKSLTGGMTITGGGLNVDSGGLTISSDGLHVYSSSASNPVALYSSRYADYLTSAYVAMQISTMSSTTNHFLIKAFNRGINVFALKANGQLQIGAGGLMVTGGISINSNGLKVTGGVTIRSGGLSISSGGLVVTGGVTINTAGFNVLRGGIQIFGGGMSIYSGGMKVTSAGLSVLSAGLAVTGGLSVNSNGLRVTGGATINTGGVYVTTKGMTVASGGMVIKSGGITVVADGLMIVTKGLTVLSGGVYVTTKGLTVVTDGVTITGGLTVNSAGAAISGGLTVNAGGMRISGGLTVFDAGATISGGITIKDTGLMVSAGGITVATGVASFLGGMSISSGLTVTNNGVTVQAGGVVVTGGLTVYGSAVFQNAPIVTSDRRLKTNLVPITDALHKVSRLQGVYYNWIQNEDSGLEFDRDRHVGLLAQEVQSVLPEAVGLAPLGGKNDKSKYLGVDYTALVPLLITAVRDLINDITLLNQKPLVKKAEIKETTLSCNYTVFSDELVQIKEDIKNAMLTRKKIETERNHVKELLNNLRFRS